MPMVYDFDRSGGGRSCRAGCRNRQFGSKCRCAIVSNGTLGRRRWQVGDLNPARDTAELNGRRRTSIAVRNASTDFQLGIESEFNDVGERERLKSGRKVERLKAA